MRHLPARHYRVTPWKNGGGTTTEIICMPEGAGLEAFDWRVSMAGVAADGPFSIFPGIDRTLSVLTGDGIRLDIEGRGGPVLDAASPPHAFPGDVALTGRLTGGAITDLNVMTRRGKMRHHVTRLHLDAATELAPLGDTLLVVADGTGVMVTRPQPGTSAPLSSPGLSRGSSHAPGALHLDPRHKAGDDKTGGLIDHQQEPPASGGTLDLARGDSLLLEAADGRAILTPAAPGIVYLIDLWVLKA